MRPIDRSSSAARPSFHDFSGDWQLSRRIEHVNEPSADFSGKAVLNRVKGGYWYREDGQLQIEGHASFTAERRYMWVDDGARVKVLFEDGRPFHHIDLSHDQPSDIHHCDPDIYDVRYDFAGWPQWCCVWRVSGPRKDYVMTSVYMRSGSAKHATSRRFAPP